MAEDKGPEQPGGAPPAEKAPASQGKTKVLVWALLTFGVVAVFGGAGFVMGSHLRKAPPEEKTAGAEEEGEAGGRESPAASDKECEYYEFEPFTVTLDTPRRDRFLVVTVSLTLRQGDEKNVAQLLEKRKRELRSKLTLYLNSRTLDDVTGAKNLNRVLREMQDLINEYLWPARRPEVTQVLLKNLVIQ